ncbi:MAG: lysozyme inhibitor LprI family protein [Pyrinomonadaceae bacterium]
MWSKFRAGVRTLLLVLFCTLAVPAQEATPTPATPDEVDREDPCSGAGDQFELNRCAARASDKADAELNKVYQQLMKDAGSAERVKLRAAQLAWIKFRDTHCDYETVDHKGGSIYPMVYSFCLAKVTAARTKQFQEILRAGLEQ